MESNKDVFDTVISIDERNTEDIPVSMSTEMEIESKREELLYFRETANAYNKKACWVAVIGVVSFVLLSSIISVVAIIKLPPVLKPVPLCPLTAP